MAVRHFAAAFRSEDQQGADAAINVDHVIGLGCAGLKRQIVHRLSVLAQVQGQRLEHLGALVEGHGTQGRAANIAGIVEHGLRIEGVVARGGDHLAGDRAGDVAGTFARSEPFACGEAGNLLDGHFGSSCCAAPGRNTF